MSVDFKKQGLDRMATGISSAVNQPTGRLVTGDITKGEVVTVEITSGEGSATVSARRTGALELARSLDADFFIYAQNTSGGKLTVSGNGTPSGTITYWVF